MIKENIPAKISISSSAIPIIYVPCYWGGRFLKRKGLRNSFFFLKIQLKLYII